MYYWMLSICCSEWWLRLICWDTWLMHNWDPLIYIMMYYEMHIYWIFWCMGYIVGHVVDELMRWSCYTSLMSHNLIYSWCMIGTLLEALASSIVGTCFMDNVAYMTWYTFRSTSWLWYILLMFVSSLSLCTSWWYYAYGWELYWWLILANRSDLVDDIDETGWYVRLLW
jgi:hypothetical protein